MKLSKILVSLLALVLVVSMCFSMFACTQKPVEDDTQDEQQQDEQQTPDEGEDKPEVNPDSLNETKTLIIQENTFDGEFNPFLYNNAYDGDAVGLVNVALLTMDPTGAIVCGDQYDTYGKSYSIFYTNDLTTYAPKEEFEEGDYVVYEVVLKNGCKFSDGSSITADDVLFNWYVYLDPAYCGSSTLYTLPILGLTDYRTQVAGASTYSGIAAKILAAGPDGYVETPDYTEDQYNAYWEGLNAAGEAFAQEIVDYVCTNYIGYAPDDIGASVDEVKADPALQVKLGMTEWGFGSAWFEGATAADYFAAMVEAYGGDYENLSGTESAGMDLIAKAAENFTLAYAEVGSIPSITGLVKGTTTIDGEEYETFKLILTEQNPKAVLDLTITVAPKAYYTAGFNYTEGALVNYGVELGINGNTAFMDHLATLNAAPMGAGVYKFVSYDGDGVTFVRNEYHETMGNENVYNATIKNVYMKAVESGKEFDALKAGDVDYATVSASADAVEEIATLSNLTSILVDNLGYGYICLNPAGGCGLENVYTRIAYTSVLDLAKVMDYYPNGLADVIYRSQSQVSWAYPEGGTAVYPFDETLATAIENFKKAGYTFDEETGKFTDVPAINFYLPSSSDDHPAGGVYLRAQELLATIGVTANIEVDQNLIANIKAGGTPSYALAWQAAADPDMYQVYHYMSAAESVISNGIKWLEANGKNDDLGTLEITKLDGSVETMNQGAALDYLAELIEMGLKYMSADERKPIYEKALEVLAQLSIEIPTYQRKNMFAYDNGIIDATTLSSTVTPYWGPLAEIWKLSFVDGNK